MQHSNSLNKSIEIATVKFYSDYIKKAREKQRIPVVVANGEKPRWLLLLGRGSGKTWTASHQSILYSLKYPRSNFAVIAPTFDDCESVCFMDEEAGIYNIIPDILCAHGDKDKAFNKSKLILTLANGSKIRGFSAQKPRKLRGKNLHACLFDELCFYEHPKEVLTQAEFATRKGKNRMFIIATTPRPIQVIRDMVKDPSTFVTRGSTYENAANLNPQAIKDLEMRYEGSAIGRQELYAEILVQAGILFDMDNIEENRRPIDQKPKEFKKLVIGFDPAVTVNPDSDMSGIVTVGQDFRDHFWALRDDSMKGTPEQCSKKLVELYHLMEADHICVEVNNGGDYLKSMIHTVDKTVAVREVRATRGKVPRFEPVSILYQQNKVHHCGPGLTFLEDEMTNWTGDKNDPSPNRLDALCWAIESINKSGSGKALWRVH